MKSVLISGLILLPLFCISQVLDSIAISQEVDSLNQISIDLANQGDYVKALEVNAIAEKIVIDNMGKESAAYGSICFNHGKILFILGRFLNAENWYLESKSIWGKVLGTENVSYAWNLNYLAQVYEQIGKFELAESYFIASAAIWEKLNGKSDAEYAWSLHNLADLYILMGLYEEAEPILLQAKEILGNLPERENLDYAICLDNLGWLYRKMDNYEKAEWLFLESKTFQEKTHGRESFEYANSLFNLGLLYKDMGNSEKADTFFNESTTLIEKTKGKEHPYYANGLNSLANLYRDKGAYEIAELHYIEAKEIREKMLGIESPIYAQSLYDMAGLYYRMENYETAELHFLQAKDIQEKILGKNNSEYALSLNSLAVLYWQTGDFIKAKPIFEEVANLNQSLMTNAVSHLSELELGKYIQSFSQKQDQMLSFTQISNIEDPYLTQVCYESNLFYKGFLLNTANQIKRLIVNDSTTTEKYNELKSYERRLAAEYTKPILNRTGLAELQEKANDLEKELVRTVSGFGEARQQVTWKNVQEKLKPGEAVAEFVSYRYFNPKPTDSIMYAVFLFRYGDQSPNFFPLFEEKELMTLIKSTTNSNFQNINALYNLQEQKGEKKVLSSLIWKSVVPMLKNISTVYSSPSGLLYRLNLGAIPIGDGKTFSDEHNLVLISSSRQLAIPDNLTKKGVDAFIIGGVRFDMDSTALSSTINSLPFRGFEEPGWLSFQPEESLRSNTWKYLAGTASEALEIKDILQTAKIEVQLDTGYFATEESIKQIGYHTSDSPRILHIATHGFFFPDPKSEMKTDIMSDLKSAPIFKTSEFPMIRSGLVLAGAQEVWTTGNAPENREDGILTAYEISQMNLSNTELVVLSACETGLGDIWGNEGVYGLQRAFKIAGAKYLIMSLWKVNDQATKELMTDFYQQWLTNGMTIPDAFRVAQQNMKLKYPESPYYWAGFVLLN